VERISDTIVGIYQGSEVSLYVLFANHNEMTMALFKKTGVAQKKWRARAWIVDFAETAIVFP